MSGLFGLDNLGNNILAQVTQSDDSDEIEQKIEVLKKHCSQGLRLFFFGPKELQGLASKDIQYISIEEVFRLLYSGERGEIYQRLVSKMLQGSLVLAIREFNLPGSSGAAIPLRYPCPLQRRR